MNVQDYEEIGEGDFTGRVYREDENMSPDISVLEKIDPRVLRSWSGGVRGGFSPCYTDGEVVSEYTDCHLGENDYDNRYDLDEEDERMCGELFLNLLCGRWTWYSYEGKIEHPVTQEEAGRYSGMSIVKLPDDMVNASGRLWGDCLGLSFDWKEYCVDHDIDSHDEFRFREYLWRRGIDCVR